MEVLRASTIQSFALSIQSLWERQFRDFLTACTKELRPTESAAQLRRSDWDGLIKAFEELRGLALQAFESFEALNVLQLLGNACRHGDGPSAEKLFELRRDLWPEWPPAPNELFPSDGSVLPSHPPFRQIKLTRELLTTLANAVIWFWDDHEYIYTNSIVRKHPSVGTRLAEMRIARARRTKT